MKPLLSTAELEEVRELGSTLEASIQVRTESQEKGQQHWHRLYERCWCGYLTVPAKYYTYDDKGIQTNTQAQAEKAYLASLGANKGGLQTPANTDSANCACGKPTRPRGTDCWKCYRSKR